MRCRQILVDHSTVLQRSLPFSTVRQPTKFFYRSQPFFDQQSSLPFFRPQRSPSTTVLAGLTPTGSMDAELWTNVMNYRIATEPQSHRSTDPHNHRATEPQSHRATETHSHRAEQPQSQTATQPHSHRAKQPQSQGAREPRLPGRQ